MLKLPSDEQILLNDARYMKYSRNQKRIIIKADIFCRQYYNNLGEVNHLQVLVPGKLLKVLLQSLHGIVGKHPGISEMMPKITKSFTSLPWQYTSETGLVIVKNAFKIDNTPITPDLIHIP